MYLAPFRLQSHHNKIKVHRPDVSGQCWTVNCPKKNLKLEVNDEI
nr:MAG TPA_asm: translation initiation factor-like protein [Caudoviricetes sp.]